MDYSNANPHYTPGWLSEQLAARLSVESGDTILDPACGHGNLLLAAAAALPESQRRTTKLVGFDSSKEALDSLRRLKPAKLRDTRLRVKNLDFLSSRKRDLGKDGRAVRVVMNPPFVGYGSIPRDLRDEIALGMPVSGRFNLAHAFVLHAIREFKPKELVALIPCTWARSQASGFRKALDICDGDWRWSEVPKNPFRNGISTQVGVLHWQRAPNANPDCKQASEQIAAPRFVVKNGVATGRDDIYRALASLGSTIKHGSIVRSVRGRDIGRGSSSLLWLPPRNLEDKNSVMEVLPSRILEDLVKRSCVQNQYKHPIDLHENMPDWFLNEPKLLLAEINSGECFRTTADVSGELLPLHSAIAIRTKTKHATLSLQEKLNAPSTATLLRKLCPRLQGDSYRLTSPVLKAFVTQLSG